jgi:hypothetical protein
MPAIRSIAELAEKYKRVTPGRRADYEAGITKPKADWETQTLAAEDAWVGGVQEAISEKRFPKGVREKGTAGWQADTKQKGPERWAPGIGYGAPKYEKNYAHYRDVIERTTLPPKFAKGDPRNFDRVIAIATALRQAKVGR